VSGRLYHGIGLNFKLNHEEEAVDAEVVIPNVSDNFNGKAPDLRASKSVVLKSSTENATLIQFKNYIAD
tara:strand:+ start:2451 stop:2657 length:207 start_codon:yes stop_codon:yes gene_type:complete